jgi:hypothetical protein
MTRLPLKSSFLAAAAYNAETRVLELEFKAGRIYQYFDVPPEVYAELVDQGKSAGKTFARISGAFAFKRVDEPEVSADDVA